MIYEEIKLGIKTAMLNKDKITLNTLRAIQTAVVNKLVEIGKKPDDTLEDQETIKVIKKLSKQRKEAMEQYEKAGRKDSAAQEKQELEILEKYLPEEMSEEAILEIINNKKSELAVADKSDKGKLIGAVMKEIQGQADGNIVSKLIDTVL